MLWVAKAWDLSCAKESLQEETQARIAAVNMYLYPKADGTSFGAMQRWGRCICNEVPATVSVATSLKPSGSQGAVRQDHIMYVYTYIACLHKALGAKQSYHEY